jgi:HEAT repeat protein
MQGQVDLTPAALAARVKDLIVKMDDDDFRVRDKAADDLTAIGPAAFTSIRKALEGKISPEAKTRLEKIIAQDGAQYLKP